MIDVKNVFADGASIVANVGAGTQLTDVLDLGSTSKKFFPLSTTIYPDPFAGTNIALLMGVSTALVGSGAKLTITLYNHTAATSIESGTIIYQTTVTVPAEGIAAGKYLVKALMPKGRVQKRYLGVYVAVATANLTAGAVDCALTEDTEYNEAHNDLDVLV